MDDLFLNLMLHMPRGFGMYHWPFIIPYDVPSSRCVSIGCGSGVWGCKHDASAVLSVLYKHAHISSLYFSDDVQNRRCMAITFIPFILRVFVH